jgi:predicted transposase/invertase (TIGR01784 family)
MKKMLTIEDFKQSRAVREYAQEYASQEVEKAEKESKLRIARNLLKTNLPMKEIAVATGLSIAEIKKLSK